MIEVEAAAAKASIKGIDPRPFLEGWPGPESGHMRWHSKNVADRPHKKMSTITADRMRGSID